MKTIGDELANNVIDVIRKLREENARLREELKRRTAYMDAHEVDTICSKCGAYISAIAGYICWNCDHDPTYDNERPRGTDMDANETIIALLKNKVATNEIYPEDIALAKKLREELGDDAPDWVRMIAGWSGDPETAAALLDEIRDELLRGLGETVDPPELTPEARAKADEFLRGLFGGEG